ncbi:MAG: tyrosine-protein phosphatase [Bacteroidales bacterium]|nr:tyrosine-protein phosphatase [Candidatus Physcousia equi]
MHNMNSPNCKRLLLILLAALTCQGTMARKWKVEPINIENEAVRQYLSESNSTFAKQAGRLARPFFDQQRPYRPDQPVGKVLRFSTSQPTARLKVMTFDKKPAKLLLDSLLTVQGGKGTFLLTNLIPGKTYYYQLTSGSKTLLEGAIKAEGQVRMIAIDKGFNIRDLGGWVGQDGKRVRYGWLYRGGSLGGTDKDGNESTLPEADRRELHRIGIRAQLDLRAPTNSGKYVGESSLHSYSLGRTPLSECDFLNKMTDYGAYNQDASVVEDVEWIIDELQKGKPVYFNCRQGADRTGTIAFVLEGLLGCYDHLTPSGANQMAMDYELTGFSQANLVDNNKVDTSHRGADEAYSNRSKLFRQILDLKAADGSELGSVQQKCFHYLAHCKDKRISKDKLEWFVRFMLE